MRKFVAVNQRVDRGLACSQYRDSPEPVKIEAKTVQSPPTSPRELSASKTPISTHPTPIDRPDNSPPNHTSPPSPPSPPSPQPPTSAPQEKSEPRSAVLDSFVNAQEPPDSVSAPPPSPPEPPQTETTSPNSGPPQLPHPHPHPPQPPLPQQFPQKPPRQQSLDDNSEPPKKKRRVLKKRLHRFSKDQIAILETHYNTGDYWPSREIREKLGRFFGCDQRKVQVWFQNQRAKMKSHKKSMREAKRRNQLLKTVAKQGWPINAPHLPFGIPTTSSPPGLPPGLAAAVADGIQGQRDRKMSRSQSPESNIHNMAMRHAQALSSGKTDVAKREPIKQETFKQESFKQIGKTSPTRPGVVRPKPNWPQDRLGMQQHPMFQMLGAPNQMHTVAIPGLPGAYYLVPVPGSGAQGPMPSMGIPPFLLQYPNPHNLFNRFNVQNPLSPFGGMPMWNGHPGAGAATPPSPTPTAGGSPKASPSSPVAAVEPRENGVAHPRHGFSNTRERTEKANADASPRRSKRRRKPSSRYGEGIDDESEDDDDDEDDDDGEPESDPVPKSKKEEPYGNAPDSPLLMLGAVAQHESEAEAEDSDRDRRTGRKTASKSGLVREFNGASIEKIMSDSMQNGSHDLPSSSATSRTANHVEKRTSGDSSSSEHDQRIQSSPLRYETKGPERRKSNKEVDNKRSTSFRKQREEDLSGMSSNELLNNPLVNSPILTCQSESAEPDAPITNLKHMDLSSKLAAKMRARDPTNSKSDSPLETSTSSPQCNSPIFRSCFDPRNSPQPLSFHGKRVWKGGFTSRDDSPKPVHPLHPSPHHLPAASHLPTTSQSTQNEPININHILLRRLGEDGGKPIRPHFRKVTHSPRPTHSPVPKMLAPRFNPSSPRRQSSSFSRQNN